MCDVWPPQHLFYLEFVFTPPCYCVPQMNAPRVIWSTQLYTDKCTPLGEMIAWDNSFITLSHRQPHAIFGGCLHWLLPTVYKHMSAHLHLCLQEMESALKHRPGMCSATLTMTAIPWAVPPSRWWLSAGPPCLGPWRAHWWPPGPQAGRGSCCRWRRCWWREHGASAWSPWPARSPQHPRTACHCRALSGCRRTHGRRWYPPTGMGCCCRLCNKHITG